ncbi:spindle and kinetochore-associated protein 3 isoform X1 [Arapaima gigas]
MQQQLKNRKRRQGQKRTTQYPNVGGATGSKTELAPNCEIFKPLAAAAQVGRMDVSSRFFSKLRSLAVTLETETARLQHAHTNPDDGGTEGALKVLHELRTEAKDLKGKVQGELACWTAEEKEMRMFIQACLVMKQRTTEDLHRIQSHYQKYGYKPLDSTTKPAEVTPAEEDSKAPDVEVGAEEQEEGEEDEEEQVNAAELPLGCRTPMVPPPPPADPMRTPRLSDFGLSGFHLMATPGALSVGFRPTVAIETPPLPDPPKMPKTPKCALQMDEDAPTPRLEDFGLSEYTTCFNNDFTMELLRKQQTKMFGFYRDTAVPVNVDHTQKRASCPTTDAAPVIHSQEAIELDSPKVPDCCTPVLKVNQMQNPHGPPDGSCSTALQLSPQLPVFETPYVKKLMSTVKSTKNTSLDPLTAEKSHPSEEPSSNGESALKDSCSHDLPMMPAKPLLKDEATPEMPSLETFPRSSAIPVNPAIDTNVLQQMVEEPQLPDLEDHLGEWSLASPPVQSSYSLNLPDPETPKMPDISQFTQDIIKLLSQSNTPAPAAVLLPSKSTVLRSTAATSGKENREQVLAAVSEDEFLALPGYLRQMPLSSLNQAIGKISSAAMDKQCDAVLPLTGTMGPVYFRMEELRRITGTGVKAHLYFLCLTELRRLEQVQDEGSGIVFRVLSQA